MALEKLTIIDGGGLSTTSDYRVGVITATKFVGPLEGSITATDATFSGNVSIGGTLTYEDVTNIDSVGIITGKGADINGDLDVDGHTNLDNINIAGVTTASGNISVVKSSGVANLSLISGDNYATIEVGGQSGAFIDLKSPASDDYDIRFVHDGFIYAKSNINLSPQAGYVVNVNKNLNCTEDLDVDGHTNLDNVSAVGFTTIGQGNFAYTPHTSSWATSSAINLVGNYGGAISFNDNGNGGFVQYLDGNGQNFYIKNGAVGGTTKTSIQCVKDGTVQLYHNGNAKLTTTSSGVTVSGDVSIDNDTGKFLVGAGQDLQLYHTGTNTYISNSTGTLFTLTDTFEVKGSNGNETHLKTTDNGAVELYHNNVKKLETKSSGINVLGHVHATSTGSQIASGDTSTNDYLLFYHDGSNGFIQNGSGNLTIKDVGGGNIVIQATDGETSIFCGHNGAVELYYNNAKKLETKTSGVGVTGNLEVGSGQITCGTHGTTGMQIINDGTFGTIHSADLMLRTASAERLRINTNGQVLIGTTTDPAYTNRRLAVATTSGTTAIEVRSATNGDGRIIFTDNTTSGNAGAYKGQIKYDQTSDYMSFNTNGDNERLRIDSSGRVLIGTTTEGFAEADDLTINSADHGGVTIRTPTNKEGNIAFSDTTSGTGEYSGLIRYRHSQNDLGLWTNSNLRLLITSGGTVGINDSSPNTYFKLDVNGHTNIVGDVALPTTNRIYWGNSDTAFIKGEHGGSAYLAFGANNEKMRLTRAGNLGIGTDNPNHELTVYGDEPYFRLTHTGSTNTLNALYTGVDGTGVEWNSYQDGTGTKRPFIFKQYTTERFRIDSNGNVGINSTTPDAPLTIYTAASQGWKFRIDTTVSEGAGFYQRSNGDFEMVLRDASNNNNHIAGTSGALQFKTSGSEALRIDSSGRLIVGGGTHAGGSALVVKGGGVNTYSTVGLFGATATPSNNAIFAQIRFGSGTTQVGATINAKADANWGSLNDYPTRLEFYTAPDGSGTVVERLRIASDGVITAQKSATFGNTSDSFTSVQITSSTSGISELRFADTTANAGYVKYEHSNNALILATNATPRLRIDSSGRVLIGTETQFGDGNDKVMIENGTVGGFVAFGSSAGFSEPIIGSMRAYWADNKKVAAINFFGGTDTTNKDDGSIRFATSSANNLTERLRIASDGKVKIGSGNAQLALLHIAPTLYGINLQNDSNNKSRILFSKNSAGNDSRAWIEGNGELNGYLAFAAGDSERVRITSTGILEIDRGSAVDQAIDIKTTATSGASRIRFMQSGTQEAQVAFSHDNNQLEIMGHAGNKVVIFSNNTINQVIDTNGHITAPNNVAFSARGGPADVTDAVVVFGTIVFQRGGTNYSTSTGEFTAPVAGIYHFMCNPYRYQTSVDSVIFLEKSTNGGSSWTQEIEIRAANNYGGDNGRGWFSLCLSNLIDLNANDKVRISAVRRVHCNGVFSRFSGFLVA